MLDRFRFRSLNRQELQVGLLFLFVIALFGVYALVLQRQTTMLKRDAHDRLAVAYQRCLVRNENSMTFNQLFTALADVERTNPYRAGQIGPRRIAAYDKARFILADCGPRP